MQQVAGSAVYESGMPANMGTLLSLGKDLIRDKRTQKNLNADTVIRGTHESGLACSACHNV